MPLIDDSETVRIDLPAQGEWVEVRKRLSRGDEIAIQRRLLTGAEVTASGLERLAAPEIIEAAEFATLEVAIRAWSFPEPVTPDNIRRLDPESVAALKAALNELYPAQRTEDERRDLSGNGLMRAEASARLRRSSPG